MHWTLDETSGNTANDDSGNGHDGTVGGTANWVAGQINGALNLDGTSNYIDLNTQVVSGTFSFTMWLNARNLPYASGYYAILHNDAWNAGSIHCHLRANTSLWNVEMNSGPMPSSTTVLQANTWYHCAYTVANVGGNNTAHIYINGVLEATDTGGSTGYLGPLNFGSWNDG
ncbi:MAG: LamG-like jellyroll fold domain-containing protein, partial [Planctomycetota bacterium]